MQSTTTESSIKQAMTLGGKSVAHTFPDPSMTLVEFSHEGLGILLAMKTDRDAANRRIVLTKVAYIRLEEKTWGYVAYPEVWIQQDAEGVFVAVEPKSNKAFRSASRRRYEVAFIGKDMFECAIQCLKDRTIAALYDLIAVTFGVRPGFSIEAGCLLAPDDYAGEIDRIPDSGLVPPPPMLGSKS